MGKKIWSNKARSIQKNNEIESVYEYKKYIYVHICVITTQFLRKRIFPEP